MKKHNFYGGPALLPVEVMAQAQEALIDFAGTGLSILEVSHRSDEFVNVMEQARSLAKTLLSLDEDYEILFLHGGGNTQFSMIPMNLLPADGVAGYVDTGRWATAAIDGARLFGRVKVLASSSTSHYNHIPTVWDMGDSSLLYTHLTTNNTVYGTQWSNELIHQLATTAPYLIADMSSDILSRDMDYTQFGLIYACAQKNLGAAGVTVVAIRRDILDHKPRPIPSMWDYRVHIAHQSMRNTPPVFAIYVVYLTLLWIQHTGLDTMYARNSRKAAMLYEAIDSSTLFQATVQPPHRSMMNVCFTICDKSREAAFTEWVKGYGIVGIEGYRLVGGYRASIYNALPEASVAVLVEAMRAFERLS